MNEIFLFISISRAAKAGGVFSGVSSKVGGWLSNAPSMPTMPAMPNISMPSVSIPGLRKTQTQDESAGVANDGLNASTEGVQPTERTEGGDEDDRSRYIRYGSYTN